MDSPILLSKQVVGTDNIHFKLDATVTAHRVLYSNTVDIDSRNAQHNLLIDKINSFDPMDSKIVDSTVQFISLVVLETCSAAPGSVQEIEIRGLKHASDDETTGGCIVVTIADNGILKLLHKPKRTKGKVTNVMGK